MEKKILIIEDEISLREVYTDMLRDADYTVDEAGDGEGALALVEAGDWDLLFLDIMLPKLDGTELLKKIKANELLKDKPVVIISNLESDEIVKNCMNQGAVEYLVKSNINPSTLVGVANKYLIDV